MEIHELRGEIVEVEELMEYLRLGYGELRKTPIEDMHQGIDELTEPLTRRFDELITLFAINELNQVRDKNPDPIVRRKIDALLFFMERKNAEDYIRKAIDAEIMNVGKPGNVRKEIISGGLSIVGYANPYLGKVVEEEISVLYGYVFDKNGTKIKVNLREKEMKISPDAEEIDIVYGCAYILEFAIREYESELWDEYKRIKMQFGKPELSGYADTEFNKKLLDKGILTDSAASETFVRDFGLYALWKSKKAKNLNNAIFSFFNEKMANFEIPEIDEIILIY